MTTTRIDKHRLRELLESELKLEMLEAGGVDNWGWYDEALNPEGEDSFTCLKAALPKPEEMGEEFDG